MYCNACGETIRNVPSQLCYHCNRDYHYYGYIEINYCFYCCNAHGEPNPKSGLCDYCYRRKYGYSTRDENYRRRGYNKSRQKQPQYNDTYSKSKKQNRRSAYQPSQSSKRHNRHDRIRRSTSNKQKQFNAPPFDFIQRFDSIEDIVDKCKKSTFFKYHTPKKQGYQEHIVCVWYVRTKNSSEKFYYSYNGSNKLGNSFLRNLSSGDYRPNAIKHSIKHFSNSCAEIGILLQLCADENIGKTVNGSEYSENRFLAEIDSIQNMTIYSQAYNIDLNSKQPEKSKFISTREPCRSSCQKWLNYLKIEWKDHGRQKPPSQN